MRCKHIVPGYTPKENMRKQKLLATLSCSTSTVNSTSSPTTCHIQVSQTVALCNGRHHVPLCTTRSCNEKLPRIVLSSTQGLTDICGSETWCGESHHS